jgi:O-antigen/teichoic acid export membrane protein
VANETGAGTEFRQHGRALRAAGRNGAFGAVGSVFASAMGFLLALQAGRMLGAGDAGLFFSAVAIAMVLTTIATAGADTGLLWALARDGATRAGASQRYLLRVALLPVAGASVLLGGGLWLVAPALGRQLTDTDPGLAAQLLRAMSVAIVAGSLLQCLAQATRGLGDVRPFALIQQIAVPGLRVALVAVVAIMVADAGALAVTWSWIVPLLALLPVAAYLAYRRTARPPDDVRHPEGLRGRFWRYSLLRGMGSTASLGLVWIDVPLVAALAGPAAAGAYAAASRFATSGQIGLQAMRLAVAPEIAAGFAVGDKGRVRALYDLSTRWATVLSWPVFLTLIVYAGPVLDWFGPGFDQAAWPLRILSVAMMVSVATGNVVTVIMMSGHSGWATRNTVLALVVTLLIDVTTVPVWGATGAAIGWLVGILLENGLGLWLVRNRLGVVAHGRGFWSCAGAVSLITLVACGLGSVVGGYGTAGCFAGAVLASVGVLAFVYVARRSLHVGLLLGRGADLAATEDT